MRHVWGLVAEKRLRDLQAVENCMKELKDKVEQARAGQDIKPESDIEKTALEIVHLQMFGDVGRASRNWKMLKLKYEKDPDQRPWFLLACWQIEELKKQPIPSEKEEPAERIKLVEDRLAQAQVLARSAKLSEKAQALALCRDIQVLYPQNVDLKGLVAKARELALKLAPR